ncbi:acetyltransferase, GNAT family [Leptospira inadai serovar Lyme str. 10]|uniref:Acetyltransferase, GNAT family n=2 Tax=Leptospira inadai serovar Lyme TaxID=293084 RepID=V6HM04_9LEPT|nr:GNAT family N-acetyltransferase [Leptospira inadai]EQA37915.1 acetyltransferase, GNAT family [Leptospira inadai serovar Lyme str. 10]PNV71892.1 GNAT family N-acetyltransferase [Leptospira inadai serovar Lyme]
MNAKDFIIKPVLPEQREAAIELVNQFFRFINKLTLDGVFKIRPRAAAKMVDIYLKLRGTEKIVFLGGFLGEELVSLLIARVEDKPYLEEEKNLYIDLAITKQGKRRSGFMKPLVEATFEWAKIQGIKAIELRAIAQNENAVAFWKSLGFDPFYIRFRKLVD